MKKIKTKQMSDVTLLVRATIGIYQKALAEALQGVLRLWWVPLVHMAALLLAIPLMGIASLFGSILGGFMMGFLFAFLIGGYFGSVAVVANKEKLHPRDLWALAVEFFSPFIGVMFVLFLITFVTDNILRNPGHQTGIRVGLHLLLAVLFNPLPEVVTRRRGFAMENFSESFEFMKENFIEWAIPFAVVLLPLALLNFQLFQVVGLALVLINPLSLMQSIMVNLTNIQLLLPMGALSVVVFFVLYFVFIFRAVLYRELASSTRRKRIYQSRFQ